jgi:hypothetical protein
MCRLRTKVAEVENCFKRLVQQILMCALENNFDVGLVDLVMRGNSDASCL